MKGRFLLGAHWLISFHRAPLGLNCVGELDFVTIFPSETVLQTQALGSSH